MIQQGMTMPLTKESRMINQKKGKLLQRKVKLPEATYLCETIPRKGNAVRFTADDQLSSWNSEEALAITDPSVTADAILIHEVSNFTIVLTTL